MYPRDSGVLYFPLGMEKAKELPMHPRYGASWEGFTLEQTLVAHGARDAYFYATPRGAELDLPLRRGRRHAGDYSRRRRGQFTSALAMFPGISFAHCSRTARL